MIKLNELRIGNLVYEAGEPSRIYQLGSGGISFFTINDINCNKETGCTLNGGEDRFKPIPLTPEMMKKIGGVQTSFNDDPNYWQIGLFLFYWHKEYGLCQWDIQNNHILTGTIHYQHLHQLQNLIYALTGMELKINI